MDLPEVVREYLQRVTEAERKPACLVSDAQGVVVACVGGLGVYGLDTVKQGFSLEAQVPAFKDLLSAEGPSAFAAVKLAGGMVVDVHVFRHEDRNYIFLLTPTNLQETGSQSGGTTPSGADARGGSGRHQSLSDVVTVLDTVVLLRRKDGTFESLCPIPEWARQFWPSLDSGRFQFTEQDEFLNGLLSAVETTPETGTQILRSSIWSEGKSGSEMLLEATAIPGSAGQLLVIKRLSAEFEARREALQEARTGGVLLEDRRVRERRRFLGTYSDAGFAVEQGLQAGGARSARVSDGPRKSETQMLHAQKLEAVGRLAGGVAHDFNNLLTVILGYSDAVLSKLSPDDTNRNDIKEIRKAAERAARLTRQLLAFGRRQIVRPETLDLGKTVTEVHMLLRRVIGEDIDLQVHVSPGLGTIHADGGQIGQVLMNLAVNSREAMPFGGQLRIGLTNMDIEKPLSESELAEGRYVRMTVADTGCGMDRETQACIFEPFFTTKPGGSGLGLSTAYGIIKQSGGEVRVESELGKGTTFTIDFPRVDVPPLSHGRSVLEVLAPSGDETVLIVDDEIQVGRLVAATLMSRGYRTLVAFHPENAENLAATYPGEIDLLLTDMVLPSRTGLDLARAIVRQRPGIRTLFMSGYTEEGPGQAAFLQKPFSSTQLVKKVREVLDRARHSPA